MRRSFRSEIEEREYVLRDRISIPVRYLFAATSTTASKSSSLLSNVKWEGFPSSHKTNNRMIIVLKWPTNASSE
jgi:hypothetical protein